MSIEFSSKLSLVDDYQAIIKDPVLFWQTYCNSRYSSTVSSTIFTFQTQDDSIHIKVNQNLREQLANLIERVRIVFSSAMEMDKNVFLEVNKIPDRTFFLEDYPDLVRYSIEIAGVSIDEELYESEVKPVWAILAKSIGAEFLQDTILKFDREKETSEKINEIKFIWKNPLGGN